MEKISDLFKFLTQFFKWYFIVMPWEQAIFIRAGKHHRLRKAGIYFKVPFLDMVYKNTTRRRVIDGPIQTCTTLDGKSITIKSGVSYMIFDMFKLYNTLYHPETTILNIVMSRIASYIGSMNADSITIDSITNTVDLKEEAANWGVGGIQIMINNFAVVKTYRLIQDHTNFYTDQLNMKHTDEQHY